MNGLEAAHIQCPYCWENIEITVDCSIESQEYIEDCQVCCKPIAMEVSITADGSPNVTARNEND